MDRMASGRESLPGDEMSALPLGTQFEVLRVTGHPEAAGAAVAARSTGPRLRPDLNCAPANTASAMVHAFPSKRHSVRRDRIRLRLNYYWSTATAQDGRRRPLPPQARGSPCNIAGMTRFSGSHLA